MDNRNHTRLPIIYAIICALIMLSLVATAHAGEPQANIGPATTDPAIPGSSVTLEMSKSTYFLGEPLVVQYHVANKGDKPFTIFMGADYRGANRHLAFTVTAVNADGKVLPDPFPNQSCMGGVGNDSTITKDQGYYEGLPLKSYVRITKPGSYTIRVGHALSDDLERSAGSNKIPTTPVVATISVNLIMPTPEQAADVVDAMDKLPQDRWAQEGKPAIVLQDFSSLSFPVYLPILEKRAASSDKHVYETAIDGIVEIPTPAATLALVELATDPDMGKSLTAMNALMRRLPEPVVDPVSLFRFNDLSDSQYLAAAGWNPSLSRLVAATAKPFLARGTPDDIVAGAYAIQCVGGLGDLDAIRDAFDKLDTDKSPTPNDGTQSRDRLGALRSLRDAAATLLKRGAQVPAQPQTIGELTIFCIAAECGKVDLSNGNAQKNVAKLFAANNQLLSGAILEGFWQAKMTGNLTLISILRPYLAGLIQSSESGTQFYAIEFAKNVKDAQIRTAILSALPGSSNVPFLVDAARAQGVLSDALLILAREMKDADTCNRAIHAFMSLVESGHGYSCDGNNAAKHLPALSIAYVKFATAHKSEIDEGKKWPSNSPEISALFPKDVVN